MKHVLLRAHWMTLVLAAAMPNFAIAQVAPVKDSVPATEAASAPVQPPAESSVEPPSAPGEGGAAANDEVDGDAATAVPVESSADGHGMSADQGGWGDAGGVDEGMMSAAELEALGFSASEGEPAVDLSISVHGFMDFTATAGLSPKGSNWYSFTIPKHLSFAIGNLNVYLSANLSESVRTMAEIRFMYMPNAEAFDYTDFGKDIQYGATEIERAYLEWSIHQYLSVRVGSYLTPVGIWNVDHGSPVIVSVNRPFIISSEMFPERQTGAEFFGRYELGANDTLGYHLTLSNGKGPLANYRDLDRNKAIGGRLFWLNRALGEFKIGASAYYGTYTISTSEPSFEGGTLHFVDDITFRARQLSLAADVQWKLDGLLVQSEVIAEQSKLREEASGQSQSLLSGAFDFPAEETFSWGAYVLAGYRFDWFGVMPYVYGQTSRWIDFSGYYNYMYQVAGGLNIRPIDAVVVKLEYSHQMYPDGNFLEDGPVQYAAMQIAWAF